MGRWRRRFSSRFSDVADLYREAVFQAECDDAGVEIIVSCAIDSVARETDFVVTSDKGRFVADSLVVATGGLSIPKMGASGLGYDIARQFGLDVLDTRAALVPFTFSGKAKELTASLSGVSVPATVSTAAAQFSEGLLFTHRGLSGPAALQVSSYWDLGEPLSIDLAPGAGPVAGRCGNIACRNPRRAPTQTRDDAARVDTETVRNRGLPHGRGHAGRRRHPCAVVTDDGSARCAGAVFHW